MNKYLYMLLAGLLALPLCGCNSDVKTSLQTPAYKTGLAEKEIRNSAFKSVFPAQYATFLRNNESEVMTEYKGSVPFMKNDNVHPLPDGYKNTQPYLKNLWLGYPFMFEYREARGHTHALKDFVHIDRINRYAEKGGLPATCWNCKTAKMMEWVGEYGDKFWAMDVNEFREKIDVDDNTIGCANCHNPTDMSLRLYSEPLKDWIVRSGGKVESISRNDMRSLVCAQCHVEYYFTEPNKGASKKPVFPWDKGFNPEDMYQYYKGHGDGKVPGFEGQFFDWIHPVSKTPLIKVQHPEYETWISGPHGAAGVACADCHMPYQREQGKKMSSHWWTSPLKDPELRACRQCHSDKTPEFLRERVLYTQEKSFTRLLAAQEVSVRAHEAVRMADAWKGDKHPDFDKLMIEARDMIRKGQLFWDYVSAENSVGFHNPALALDTLYGSSEASNKAIQLAIKATNYGIAADLEGDIAKLVPPILTMSRKLQQDPEYLKTHPWLNHLKPFPAADLFWDGTKRVSAK